MLLSLVKGRASNLLHLWRFKTDNSHKSMLRNDMPGGCQLRWSQRVLMFLFNVNFNGAWTRSKDLALRKVYKKEMDRIQLTCDFSQPWVVLHYQHNETQYLALGTKLGM